jgi:uncharacterized protein YegL
MINVDQMWDRVQKQLDKGTSDNHFLFFAMGVGGADMNTLSDLVSVTDWPALKIKEGMFKEYFQFVSNSLARASHPDSGDTVQLSQDKLDEITQIDVK